MERTDGIFLKETNNSNKNKSCKRNIENKTRVRQTYFRKKDNRIGTNINNNNNFPVVVDDDANAAYAA